MIHAKRPTRPVACGAMVRNASQLLRAAGLRADPAAVIEVLRSAPATVAEADLGPERGLCAACLISAEASPMSASAFRLFLELATYFLDELPAMPPRRRERLEREVE